MKFDEIKTKVTDFCRKVGKRNFIIFGAVALTVIAIAVNVAVFSQRDKGYDYDQSAGMDPGTTNTTPDTTPKEEDAKDSYFSSVQIDRQRTRDEAIEVLQLVVDNPEALDESKSAAMAEISKIAKDIDSESKIESLVVAKGFEKCVAVIGDEKCNVIVKTDATLLPNQVAQIYEIVYQQSGILPANVYVIEKKAA